jgi:hypothetical protein
MLKLCNIDISRSQEVFERIERYKNKVIQELKPKKIILFGSLARGDFNEGSDVDLIVISDWQEDFLDRIKVLLDMNQFGLPLEPIGYTEEELEKMSTEGNRFITEIMATGKVLYSQQKHFSKNKKTNSFDLVRKEDTETK